MTLLRRAVRGAQRFLPDGHRGTTVLCYHLVGGGTVSPVDLPLSLFRGHMDELADTARVIPLEDALTPRPASVEEGERGIPRVVLTFDDAYENFARTAFAILDELSFPCTLFVPVDFLDGKTGPPNRHAPLAPLSWRGLKELADTGLLEVGSHTSSHRALPGLSDEELSYEVRGSKERLEDALSRPVRSFCYPGALWNPGVEERVARVYDRAVIGGGRKARPDRTSPLRIQRVSLRRDGPRRLAPVLSADLWLEERLADFFRRWVPGPAAR